MHMFNVSTSTLYRQSIKLFLHIFNESTLYRQKYQIAPSKAVVGVDRPLKALSMHIQKPYKEKIV